jgi:hypothetical protein
MKRLLPTLACFVLLGLASVSAQQFGDDWNKDVVRLFSPAERDEALQKLLKEARYPKDAAYKEDDAGKIKDVVLCPNPNGRPMVTVFAETPHGRVDVPARSGHFIIIRNDGMIIPFYCGANSLDGYYRDLNGDGVIDYLESWDFGYDEGNLTGLHLVPITEKFIPALVVYWKDGDFTWRLIESEPGRDYKVEIGSTKRGRFELVAEYKWSKDEKRWVGPEGSVDAGFVRVDGDPNEKAKKLLMREEKKDGEERSADAPEWKPEG